jgi:hypothetical protein
MFSPPEKSQIIRGIKYICLQLFTVFYLIQASSKQIICIDFGKQNGVLPIVFYVPWFPRRRQVKRTRKRFQRAGVLVDQFNTDPTYL